MPKTKEVPQTDVQEVQGGLLTETEEEIVQAAAKMVRDQIRGLTEPFQRLALRRALGAMGDEGAEQEAPGTRGEGRPDVLALLAEARRRQRRKKPDLDADQIWITLSDFLPEDDLQALMDGIELAALSPAGEVADAAGPERRFRLNKAKGELRPLAEFLMGATYREKLITIAVDRLSNGDIAHTLGPKKAGLYDGEIGGDIREDWMDDVFSAADGNQQLPPTERALAAFVAGMSLSAW